MKKVIKRMKKPTPVFFKQLRNIGVALSAVSAGILLIETPLPKVVIETAGYMAVAGVVASGVSQAAVKNEKK